MKRFRITTSEQDGNIHIGYWDGNSGFREEDFRSIQMLPRRMSYYKNHKEIAAIIKEIVDSRPEYY